MVATDPKGRKTSTSICSTAIASVDGFVGSFKTTLSANGQEVIEHGVAVVATGGAPYRPTEYGYGTDPRIITSLELDRKLMDGDPAQSTQQRGLHPVRRLARTRAALLLARVLHALGG
jgi:heterodisulfide reductase subunit A-like polyferredoxin